MASIKCGNCGQTHTSVNGVRACYRSGGDQSAVSFADGTTTPQTDATYAIGTDMHALTEKHFGNNPIAQAVIAKSESKPRGRRPRFEESVPVKNPLPMFEEEPDEQGTPKVVFVPMQEPGASTRNANDQTIPGFYKVDGEVFKVTPARGSNRTFAHQLSVENTPENPAPVWLYRGLGKRFVPMYADKLSLIDAKAYGHTHGYCLICGRLLTAEQSVKDGIGPICAGKL